MQVVVESFDRPNLHYSAVHCRCATAEDGGASAGGQSLAPLRALLQPLQEERERRLSPASSSSSSLFCAAAGAKAAPSQQRGALGVIGPSAIVYCPTRRACEQLADALNGVRPAGADRKPCP